jgi:hypothetical protein
MFHRKDGSLRRHIIQGELPKVGDAVPATLADKTVSTKVGAVNDLVHNPRVRGHVIIEVHAEEV